MSRSTSLVGLFFLVAPFVVAQDPQLAAPQVPEDAFATRQLIAWSNLQKPQPAPQPMPPQDNSVPQPGQTAEQQAKPPADPQTQQTPAQSFTGKIVKDAGTYVLRVGKDSAYQLSQQTDLGKYENQTVKVIGNLDASGKTIHIVKIELMS